MADNPTTNAMPLPGSDEAIMRCCTGRRRPTMIRVCPKRDRICPHGDKCPYAIDRYSCKPEPQKKETDDADK